MPSETAEKPLSPLPEGPGFLERWGNALIGIPLLAAIYFIAGKLGLRLAVANENATTIWPPTGIALAACLVFGIRLWPGVLLGAFLVNLTTSGSWTASVGIALGNTAEAVVGCVLVNRYANGRRAFDHIKNVFRFTVLAGFLSTALSAVIGILSLRLSGQLAWAEVPPIWFTWWLGDLGGDVILAPLLILGSTRPAFRWSPVRFMEGLLLVAVLCILSSAVFGGWLPFSGKNYAIGFLCIPAVLWASFRFGSKITAAVIVLLSAVALWGTLSWVAPSPRESKIETLLLLQAFLGVISITALAVAAAVEERRRASEHLAQRLDEVARLNAQLDQQKEEIGTYHGLLTHDISNFAMALLGLVERLLLQADGPLTPKQEELIRRSNRQALEMNRMAENTRVLVRVREKGLPPRKDPVVVRDVLRRAVDLVRDLHFDRPFHCEIDCAPDATLRGMPLLDSILINLVDNAVRHNPKGAAPEIRIEVRSESPRMSLTIQGGVPPSKEVIASLFEREVSRGRSSGHGIGLVLVREILRKADGSISARSVKRGASDVFEVNVSLPVS